MSTKTRVKYFFDHPEQKSDNEGEGRMREVLPRLILASLVSTLFSGCLILVRMSTDETTAALAPGVTTVTLEKRFPTNGADWNHYILRDLSESDITASADVACPRTFPDIGFQRCFHGAEYLIIDLPESITCDRISINDSLNAFIWDCEDSSSPTKVYSRGLRLEKGLQDLVDTNGWIPNQVSIYVDGTLKYQTSEGAWWENPVVAITPDPGVTTVTRLNQPETIYVVGADGSTNGYFLEGDHIGFVVSKGATLRYAGGATQNCCRGSSCMGDLIEASNAVCVVNVLGWDAFHNWIEGTIDAKPAAGTTATVAVNTTGSVHFMFRNIVAKNAATYGLAREFPYGDRIYNVAAVGNGSVGIYDHYSDYQPSQYINIVTANNGSHGISFYDGGAVRVSNLKTFNNGGHGLFADFNTWGVYTGILSASNAGDGIQLANVWDTSSTLSNIIVANNGGDGLEVEEFYAGSIAHILAVNNTGDGLKLNGFGPAVPVSGIVSAHNGLYGIAARATFAGTFNGLYRVGGNTSGQCVKDAGASGIDNSCTVAGTIQTNLALTGASDAFFGMASSDSANTADTNGTAAVASVTDWLNFDNFYRVWGKDAASKLHTGARGRCTAGTCRIWDFRTLATDAFLLNKSGNLSTNNAIPSAGVACPAYLDGNRNITTTDSEWEVLADGIGDDDALCEGGEVCTERYLLNAREIIGDGFGNDDGLCESREKCVASPNFGMYQGEGELSTGSCTLQNPGVVEDIELRWYLTNGA